MLVEPGGNFTDKINETEFIVEVFFRPVPNKTGSSILEKLRKFIKDEVATELNGEVKHSYTGI